jgi:hypothetical protein
MAQLQGSWGCKRVVQRRNLITGARLAGGGRPKTDSYPNERNLDLSVQRAYLSCWPAEISRTALLTHSCLAVFPGADRQNGHEEVAEAVVEPSNVEQHAHGCIVRTSAGRDYSERGWQRYWMSL